MKLEGTTNQCLENSFLNSFPPPPLLSIYTYKQWAMDKNVEANLEVL
jgi:hypothetical protein